MEKWMQDRWESRRDKSKRDKTYILKNWISLWPRSPMFLPGRESNPHVCAHILQSQPHTPGEGFRNLLHEGCRLSVSRAGLEVVLPVYIFPPATGTQLLVWFLLLASIHPSAPSVTLSLPYTHSRLSPEGRLTRAWCTLAFPTSNWNVYTGIFCGRKMGEYPNVRERFDVNTSKSQYFTDKMATPFGPFYTSTLNPASKTGLPPSCLGTVGVFPSSLLCHLGHKYASAYLAN